MKLILSKKVKIDKSMHKYCQYRSMELLQYTNFNNYNHKLLKHENIRNERPYRDDDS